MLYIPIVDTIVTQPTLSSEKNTEPLFNFDRFKLNQIKKFPQSPTSRTNNSTRLNPVRNTVAFGSSQERKKAEKTILPPLQYNLNFRSVDKHQASPILRTNRTNRIKSEISQSKCTHCMITIQRTEACAQTIQQNQENYIARLIQKAKTPKKEIQPKVQLQIQEFIPMSSKQLKESLKSLMQNIIQQKAEIWLVKTLIFHGIQFVYICISIININKLMQDNPKCYQHNKDIVAFDMSRKDEKSQGLCLLCLGTERNNVIYVEDAQERILQIKTELQQRKDEQNRKNILILRDLYSNVMELKKFIDTSINKLTGNIDQWIACLEKEQISEIQLLNDIAILNQQQLIHQDQDFTSLLKVLNNQFNNIIKNIQLEKCMTILSSLDIEPIIINSSIKEGNYRPKAKSKLRFQFQCQKHDQEIIMLNLNQKVEREDRILCVECIQEKPGSYVSSNNFQQIWNQFESGKENQLSSFHKKYQEQKEYYKSKLQQFRENYNHLIHEAINQLNDQNLQVESNVLSILKPLRKNWQQISKEEVIDIAEELSYQQNQDSMKNLESEFLVLQEEISKIIVGTQSQLSDLQQQFIQETKSKTQSSDKKNKSLKGQLFKINFELQENSLLQNEKCTALRVSTDKSIVVAGCNQKIRVFEFQAGCLKQKQYLEYSSFVKTIYIMKNSNQFVTGSQDYSISIWAINNKNLYYQSKVLKNVHQKSVNCIIVFREETQMISCSEDQTIKFWKNIPDWDCFQTLRVHNSEIYSLSLNPNEDQLVSCDADGKIIVSQKVNDDQWEMLKVTQVDFYGLRINFISDKLIVFQPAEKEVLEVYDWEKESKELKKINEISGLIGKCPTFIQPIVYIPQRSIIATKQGSNIYLIRNENNQFILDQAIRFDDDCIKFDLSEDGSYLISWDGRSRQFQVRILK